MDAEQLYLDHEYLVGYWIRRKYGSRLPSDVQNDLESVGLMALHTATQNYDPDNEEGAKFKTYASAYIKLSFANYFKTKNMPEPDFGDTIRPPKPDEFLQEDKEQSIKIGKKEPDRQALQILEVLRMWSDENHTLTQQDIIDWHYAYCYEKHGFTDKQDRRTMSKLIKNLILELDPYEYSETNKDDYKILYDGFDKDLLKKSLESDVSRKEKTLLLKWLRDEYRKNGLTWKEIAGPYNKISYLILILPFSTSLFRSYFSHLKIVTKILVSLNISSKYI
jgi:hypothetical protein